MCLAVPMRVVEKHEGTRVTVEAEGVSREADISLIDGAEVGDYLIVHAGFAIEKLDPREADARIELFTEIARIESGQGGKGA